MEQLVKCTLLIVGWVFAANLAFADLDEELEKPVEKAKAPAIKPAPAPGPVHNLGGDLNAGRPSPKPAAPKPTATPKSSGSGTKTANQPMPATPATEHGAVHFTSKGASGAKKKGMMELIDDVVVTQDDLKLEADKAIAYFDEKTDQLLRVEALGDVRIFKNDIDVTKRVKANGKKAIFFNADQTVILTGDAKLWRGDDLMRGKQITYEIPTGMVRADTVEGVLKSSSEGAAAVSKSPASEKSGPTEQKGKSAP